MHPPSALSLWQRGTAPCSDNQIQLLPQYAQVLQQQCKMRQSACPYPNPKPAEQQPGHVCRAQRCLKGVCVCWGGGLVFSHDGHFGLGEGSGRGVGGGGHPCQNKLSTGLLQSLHTDARTGPCTRAHTVKSALSDGWASPENEEALASLSSMPWTRTCPGGTR